MPSRMCCCSSPLGQEVGWQSHQTPVEAESSLFTGCASLPGWRVFREGWDPWLVQTGAADALIHWQLLGETREPWSNFTCPSSSDRWMFAVEWSCTFVQAQEPYKELCWAWRKSTVSWKLKWVVLALTRYLLGSLRLSSSIPSFASTTT